MEREVARTTRSGPGGFMYVGKFMTTDVITLHEDDTLDLAQSEMGWARIRHIPVIRRGRLVGLVTQRDVLGVMHSRFAELDDSQQKSLLSAVAVDEIMEASVLTIDPEATMAEAGRLMLDNKIGCLPVVVDGDRLIGIITNADFVELAARLLEGAELNAKTVDREEDQD